MSLSGGGGGGCGALPTHTHTPVDRRLTTASRRTSALSSIMATAATALGRRRIQLTQDERALVGRGRWRRVRLARGGRALVGQHQHGPISRLPDVPGGGLPGTEFGPRNAMLAILNDILGKRFGDAGPAGIGVFVIIMMPAVRHTVGHNAVALWAIRCESMPREIGIPDV